MKFLTPFSNRPAPSVKAVDGLTQQHFKEECDLNVILRRFRLGVPPPVEPPRYEDLTERPLDLADAFERAAVAQEWFDGLPSDVRAKFGNDVTVALRLVNSDVSAAVQAGLLPGVDPKFLAKAAEAATPEPQKKAAEATSGAVATSPKPSGDPQPAGK